MEKDSKKLLRYLFESNALEVNTEKPFWYTSGKIGPYFFSTQNVAGGKENAQKILTDIDTTMKNDAEKLESKILHDLLNLYLNDSMYRSFINAMIKKIDQEVNAKKVDFISGGERRDWFFSFVISYILGKHHLNIRKEDSEIFTSVICTNHEAKDRTMIVKPDELKGSTIVHVTDLINIADSFRKLWIPGLARHKGKIAYAVAGLDRLDGGSEILLSEHNIYAGAALTIDEAFLSEALKKGLITPKDYNIIKDYKKNQDAAMNFYLNRINPDYIIESLNSLDPKTRERAQKCINNNYYPEACERAREYQKKAFIILMLFIFYPIVDTIRMYAVSLRRF